jgi:hypothetical protein
MSMSSRYPRRRVPRVALLTLAAALTAGAQTLDEVASASTTAPPYSLFQNATLTGTGNTVTATWLPVVTTKGTTYKNVTIQFNVDALGNLTIAPGYPQVAVDPPIIVSAFKAGKYVGPSNVYSGEMSLNIDGPGVTVGGATEWTLAGAPGAFVYTYPESATWYVGAIASSPLAARLKAAGITSTAWTYGVGGGGYGGAYWYNDSLLGFSQVGKTITIVSFTHSGADKAEPVDQITYTLVP